MMQVTYVGLFDDVISSNIEVVYWPLPGISQLSFHPGTQNNDNPGAGWATRVFEDMWTKNPTKKSLV